jgi:glutathione S-transferase
MSLKLYFAPGACSFVPHSLLELSGAPFEPLSVKLHKGEQHSADYLSLNPRGQVPVLVDGSDVITQIMAIVLHLDQRLPQAHLLPKAGLARSRVMETFAWLNNTVHPAFTHVFMPQKFTDDTNAQAAVKAFGKAKYRELLLELEALVARKSTAWFTGEHPGVLDAYATTVMRWGGFAGIDPTSLTATWALANAYTALPAVARAVEREKLQLNVYQPG